MDYADVSSQCYGGDVTNLWSNSGKSNNKIIAAQKWKDGPRKSTCFEVCSALGGTRSDWGSFLGDEDFTQYFVQELIQYIFTTATNYKISWTSLDLKVAINQWDWDSLRGSGSGDDEVASGDDEDDFEAGLSILCFFKKPFSRLL